MKIFGNIVDIHKREIYSGKILIEGDRIISIERSDTKAVNYIIPGFIDAHIHIESSMLTPAAFAATAVGHGTVGVVCDPHEIANVMGVEGIEFMIQNSEKAAIDFYFGVPSCVPATPFESNGASVGVEETAELLARGEIKFLAEMMNFPGVISGEKDVLEKLEEAKKAGKPVDGHAPGLSGDQLKRYIAGGITTDHEATGIEEAREKIRGGMKILIREGSAARNLESLHSLVEEHPDDVMLCCDDIHPEMLLSRHINSIVAELVAKGHDIFNVLRAASLNPVLHYKLETGLLRKGDKADFIIVNNLIEFGVEATWIGGKEVFSRHTATAAIPVVKAFNRFVSEDITPDDIRVVKRGPKLRVIEVYEGQLYTGEKLIECNEDIINPDPVNDILKIVVKDRYRNLPPSVAFINGFGLKRGAFASSVAHDSHNIIAVGADDDSIAAAVNEVVRIKGGLALYDRGMVDSVQLEIAGIMTNVPCGTIAGRYEELSARVKEMGSVLDAPFMTLSFMALLVIPELKLGDRGLFNLKSYSFVDIFA